MHTAQRRRLKKTIEFMERSLPSPTTILDLGTPNALSAALERKGHTVVNTHGEDLDFQLDHIRNSRTEIATAFEILEHLVNPLGVLQTIPADHLFASVPLSLWFARAYRHATNEWDWHFHEFEDWQFDWLLEKAGWKVVRREKWISPVYQLGVRPLLRLITPRYYIVEARRER